ncbi:MAG: site-specific DNA-methyltransferase [Candidatus Hadarchaeum sp.]
MNDCLDRETLAWSDHRIYFGDSREMVSIQDSSVDLIVTSPPYPMVEMWDETFTILNRDIGAALRCADGPAAFEMMHLELDKVWRQCFRVLKPGGLICINIGDAVRSLRSDFRIYPNHARVLLTMQSLGFITLPDILWRKPTNAPNKFMGSGMLPVGAYVTYEHEYILIFRKGDRRQFRFEKEKKRRRESAFFWEERNVWFSDVWTDLKGINQELDAQAGRSRSGAYPVELPYRLICMFSVYGDTVLDPFLGSGTTVVAAIMACRHSIGMEYFDSLKPLISQNVNRALAHGSAKVSERYKNHVNFVECRVREGHRFKYTNCIYHFPVMTAQEKDLVFYKPICIEEISENFFRVKNELMLENDG